jgi:hypothetical protein
MVTERPLVGPFPVQALVTADAMPVRGGAGTLHERR